MEEYVANGASLGWLIDFTERRVHVYQPSAEALCLDNPATISGEPLLPGIQGTVYGIIGRRNELRILSPELSA